MLIIVAIGVITTCAGLKNGVERVTKVMMVALFVVLVALCVRAVTLPGAEEGLEFYLMPDFGKLFAGTTPAENTAPARSSCQSYEPFSSIQKKQHSTNVANHAPNVVLRYASK